MRLSPKHVWIGELTPASSSFKEISDLMAKTVPLYKTVAGRKICAFSSVPTEAQPDK